jgi:hypothetical protein
VKRPVHALLDTFFEPVVIRNEVRPIHGYEDVFRALLDPVEALKSSKTTIRPR